MDMIKWDLVFRKDSRSSKGPRGETSISAFRTFYGLSAERKFGADINVKNCDGNISAFRIILSI